MADIEAYTARIAEAAVADGVPAMLDAFQAASLGMRYGVVLSTASLSGYRLHDVAQQIATRILGGNIT